MAKPIWNSSYGWLQWTYLPTTLLFPNKILPLVGNKSSPGHETSRGQPKNLPGVVLKTLGSLLPDCCYVIFATTPASMCNLDLKKSSHEKTGKNLTFYFRHLLQQHFVHLYLFWSKFCALLLFREKATFDKMCLVFISWAITAIT